MRTDEISLALSRLRRNYWRQKDVMDVCDELEKRLGMSSELQSRAEAEALRLFDEQRRKRKEAMALAKQRRFLDENTESGRFYEEGSAKGSG